jgi:hypothetical protein
VEVVAIGTSTGGPNALAKVIPLIPVSYLSLPSVADGIEYNFTICKSNVESEVKFECEGEEFAVSLLRRKYGSS